VSVGDALDTKLLILCWPHRGRCGRDRASQAGTRFIAQIKGNLVIFAARLAAGAHMGMPASTSVG
jgi:hypothetical protein